MMLTTVGRDRFIASQSHTHLAKSSEDLAYRKVGFAFVKPIDRGTDFEHKG
jgi:hypothetical protein